MLPLGPGVTALPFGALQGAGNKIRGRRQNGGAAFGGSRRPFGSCSGDGPHGARRQCGRKLRRRRVLVRPRGREGRLAVPLAVPKVDPGLHRAGARQPGDSGAASRRPRPRDQGGGSGFGAGAAIGAVSLGGSRSRPFRKDWRAVPERCVRGGRPAPLPQDGLPVSQGRRTGSTVSGSGAGGDPRREPAAPSGRSIGVSGSVLRDGGGTPPPGAAVPVSFDVAGRCNPGGEEQPGEAARVCERQCEEGARSPARLSGHTRRMASTLR